MDISVRDLEFSYRGTDASFRLSISQLDISPGQRIAVIGPSGSGKSTMLQLIAGILLPDRGTISVGNHHVSKLDDAGRRAFRIRNIGFIFQDFELIDYLNVVENILLPYRLNPQLRLAAEDRLRARDLCQRLGLKGKETRTVTALSQGERQRVAIGRALIHKPGLLLADEPTGNLDPANKHLMVDLLKEAAAHEETSLVMVTHDHALLDGWDRILDFKDLISSTPVTPAS